MAETAGAPRAHVPQGARADASAAAQALALHIGGKQHQRMAPIAAIAVVSSAISALRCSTVKAEAIGVTGGIGKNGGAARRVQGREGDPIRRFRPRRQRPEPAERS
jgi:hypothetical protein